MKGVKIISKNMKITITIDIIVQMIISWWSVKDVGVEIGW